MTQKAIARRNFLKLSGMVGAAAATGLGGLRLLEHGQAQAAAAFQDQWIPTCCNMCGGTSGIFARVYNGRVIKIEPNSFNPIGLCNISTDFTALQSTGARICPKGNAGIMTLYDPDRIKKPLKRVGARAKPGIESARAPSLKTMLRLA